jgi:NADH:ubiquinone reductase (H+-translocating)
MAIDSEHTMRPRVVIVGGGFGGLACAKALGDTQTAVTVIDRRNHNLFQPLLYQVATAALSPADISEPIRRTLGGYHNVRVMLDEVVGVDRVAKTVKLENGGVVGYDFLVLATGSVYNYFAHPEWQELAPGLKSIHEARLIRQRLLIAFEQAEQEADPGKRKALLTSVIIGGGPTGVEMSGAISELGRYMIARDFRNISTSDMRVILVEAGDRLLAAFPEDLATYAQRHLESIGIEIRLDKRVTDVRPDGVSIGEEAIPCGCVVWGAGIKPSPAATWFGFSERHGKIPVDEFLRMEGSTDIFSIGDTAAAEDALGNPLPALAQVAKQQGEYLGRQLTRTIAGQPTEPFVFHNRGNTAVVGRHAAVFDFGRWKLKGTIAWFLWAVVHVLLLVNFEKRILVSVQWIWRYVTKQRGARLIDENAFEPGPGKVGASSPTVGKIS